MAKIRFLAALLLTGALAACNSVSSDNEGDLSSYLDNASQYYEGGHFKRAYQQWDKALQLDSSNEGARLGQAMSLYQMGREESAEAVKQLAEGTRRLEALLQEDFGRDQWKIEMGVGLAHLRWCDLYDRMIRKIGEDEKKGVAPDEKKLATCKSEFASSLDIADRALHSVLGGEAQAPRDRLTCWVGLAQIAYWRGDLTKSLDYAKLYLDQVMKSEKLWQNTMNAEPQAAAVYQGKLTGAQLQEAELRDLIGSVYFKMGQPEKAEEELTKVIKMFPQRATAYLNRGIIRQLRGDDDLARADLRKFLSTTDRLDTDPSIVEASRRLAEVEGRLALQEAKEREGTPPQH